MADAPPPEAQLIERLRQQLPSDQSAASKVAARAGISEGRWRQIAKGYQQADKETRVRVVAPAATLARMAAVVGATPADLKEAGREDAAIQLRQLTMLDGAQADQKAGVLLATPGLLHVATLLWESVRDFADSAFNPEQPELKQRAAQAVLVTVDILTDLLLASEEAPRSKDLIAEMFAASQQVLEMQSPRVRGGFLARALKRMQGPPAAQGEDGLL